MIASASRAGEPISYRIGFSGGSRSGSVPRVEIEWPEPRGDHELVSFVAGTGFANRDGSSRREIVEASVRPGDMLGFRIEEDNPEFPSAVAVFATNGKQLGYLPGTTGLAGQVRKWHKDGCIIRLTVNKITSGGSDDNSIRINLLVQVYEEHAEESAERISMEMKILEHAIERTGHFVQDQVSTLIAILQNEREHSYGKLVHSALDYGGDTYTPLSTSEKRSLGLNPRKRYTKELISYFLSPSLREIEPKDELYRLQTDAYYRAKRRCFVAKIKKLGFINYLAINNTHGCIGVAKLQGSALYIADVPELPFPECDKVCSCYFEPFTIHPTTGGTPTGLHGAGLDPSLDPTG